MLFIEPPTDILRALRQICNIYEENVHMKGSAL